MLDIKFIRQNPEKVKECCCKKQVNVDIDRLLNLDKQHREALTTLEDMRAQKNKASKKISGAKNEKEKKKIILEMQKLDTNSDRVRQAHIVANCIDFITFSSSGINLSSIGSGNFDALKTISFRVTTSKTVLSQQLLEEIFSSGKLRNHGVL